MLLRGTALVSGTVSSLNQPPLELSWGKLSLVACYGHLVHILTSTSSRDVLYMKVIPRFSTETRLVICTGAGM